ncbi:MAG: hypothetical protein L3J19_03670 [Sulfurimonas sp.]|nr:hypothetical protein [Sulfurimonas sp.]
MKSLFILLFLSFTVLASENISAAEKPRVMLESISKYAIHMGTGDAKVVYLFVDPMCRFSRRLLTKISKNKTLQLTNSYYIFLYKHPILKSTKAIQYIYQSDDPKSLLFEIMIDEEVMEFEKFLAMHEAVEPIHTIDIDGDIIDLDDFQAKDETLKSIDDIAKVAKQLDMERRPYLISFEKGSKHCSVSEGVVPCLEDFEYFED